MRSLISSDIIENGAVLNITGDGYPDSCIVADIPIEARQVPVLGTEQTIVT